MTRQLGRALSVLAKHFAQQEMIGMDLAAFHAPGECYPLAFRNRDREEREAMRHARSLSGLTRRKFKRVAQQNRRYVERAAHDILNRWLP